MLANRDGELLSGQAVRFHPLTFNERGSRIEVLVSHEIDRQTGSNSQFSLLDRELL